MLLGPACFIRNATTRLVPYRTLYISSYQHAQSAGDSPPSPRKARFAAAGSQKLTLEHFVLRSKSIKLYRDFIRATRNIPNPDARRETVSWLRDEHFEGPSGLKAEFDLVRIKELLMMGSVTLKRICGPMELVAALNPQHGSFPKLRGSRTST